MDRLDRTLHHLVDEGRVSVLLADEISQEFHERHVDVKQRLAELAGYAGAALATVGLVVIGAQVWDDFDQVLRAGIPAAGCIALMVAVRFTVRSVPHLVEHPVRGRLAQVMGLVAAILGTLAIVVAFPGPDYGSSWNTPMAIAVGLALVLLTCVWAPGILSTVGAAGFTLAFAMSAGDAAHWGGPGEYGVIFVVLGASAALLLKRFFPPAWFTQVLGIAAWLFGSLMLLMSHEEYALRGEPWGLWMWLGRAAVVAIILVGTWHFAHGQDVSWAVGAAAGAAMLVGLWSAEALNAGVALVLAGVVLIGVGLLMVLWRRSAQSPDGAKMEK